jgi:hypothetical protein
LLDIILEDSNLIAYLNDHIISYNLNNFDDKEIIIMETMKRTMVQLHFDITNSIMVGMIDIIITAHFGIKNLKEFGVRVHDREQDSYFVEEEFLPVL